MLASSSVFAAREIALAIQLCIAASVAWAQPFSFHFVGPDGRGRVPQLSRASGRSERHSGA